MRWQGRPESGQVEDRRGFGGRGVTLGCGTILIALIISWLTGTDPIRLIQLLGGGSPSASTEAPPGGPPAEGQPDEGRKFVSVVLADTEQTWQEVFAASGKTYELPKLVLYTGAAETACGYGSAAQGPFYCPLDRKVYLDLSFFDELDSRFGAPGDFAQAYVIAHEVGHHVQNLLGIEGKVRNLRERVSEERGNELSVRLELQADCLAGVWGHHGAKKGLLEPGDAEEGLRAAASIGDDRLQRMSTGRVQPESFTHGSSAQRVEWLRRGLESGDPGACGTFEGIF
jgi:predicted metalloprotease